MNKDVKPLQSLYKYEYCGDFNFNPPVTKRRKYGTKDEWEECPKEEGHNYSCMSIEKYEKYMKEKYGDEF